MAIERITAAAFAELIRTAILDRTTAYDTAVGPIPDVITNPLAVVFENQNDRAREIFLLLSRENLDQFAEADVDGYVANEGIIRSQGGRSTATVSFIVTDRPVTNLTVPRGFPIGTQPDSLSGDTIVYVTSEDAELDASNPGVYFTGSDYRLDVPAISVITGGAGVVGPNRLTRPLRSLVGFTSVTNSAGSSSVPDRESNVEVDARYGLAITGRQIGTPTGIERYIRDTYPDVEDQLVVYGADEDLTRADDDAGAADVLIVAEDTTQVLNETVIFLGFGQVLEVAKPPLVSVSRVMRQATSTVYVEGTDFEVIQADSDVSGSTRAADGVRFLFSASTAPLPVEGDPLSVTYRYNTQVRAIQADFDTNPETGTLGADVLIRAAEQVDVTFAANVKTRAGFDPTTVLELAAAKLATYVNALRLREPLEESDIQAEIRTISGIDNFIITTLALLGSTGVADITVTSRQYIRIADTDISLTPI